MSDAGERTTPAYDAMADFYDALKAGDNYDAWVEALLAPIRRLGTGGTRLLDVGCGTGLSSLAFRDRGFDVTGCDVAGEMIEVARARSTDDPVEFVVADMRRLPESLGTFDVVTWVDDVANHLLDPADLVAALGSSRERLRPGGLVVFDTNSRRTFATLFGNAFVVEHPDSFFTLHGRAGASPTDPARLRVVGFLRDGEGDGDAWRRREATVEERYYSAAEIEEHVRAAGLEPVATLGWSERRMVEPASEDDHVKIVYLARRP